MAKREDVAYVFFHGNTERSLAVCGIRHMAIAQRWASKSLGLNPGPVFRITPPKPKRRGRK